MAVLLDVPVSATYEVWPQFRSSLTWDFWAISAHAVMTAIFWYVGLIPDLATLRDRASSLRVKQTFGLLALGWNGSSRHWAYHQAGHRILAIIILPLILVMQSVVSLEHAVMLPPAWHQSSQPLYYIVSGLTQGLATVLLVAVLLRHFLRLERLIDDIDVDLMAKLLAAAALLVAYVYVGWIFLSLLDDEIARAAALTRMFAAYGGLFWGALALMILPPQLLWFRRMRASLSAVALIALAVNLGVWLDRFSIMVGGLEKNYVPWGYALYWPTVPEWFLLFGTVGLFSALLLLFVRTLPVVSMFETRHDEYQEKSR